MFKTSERPAMSRDDRESGLSLFLRKLMSHSPLTPEAQSAIASLPFSYRRLEPNGVILREGDPTDICPVLLSGFAFRQKATRGGGRQIVALKMPGDPLDFQSLYVRRADHTLQALTTVELAVLANADVERLLLAHAGFARSVVADIVIEASIGREWLLNIGRRNALSRLAHLVCEIHYRLYVSGRGLLESDLPLTQEQLADLLGLTTVHVNRTIKALERQGAINRNGRRIRIGDLDKLRTIAEFNDLYLHPGDAEA